LHQKKYVKSKNKFGTPEGYKINIQKSITFLYTNEKLSEQQIKKAISSITAIQN
jgi:hypothetical protein